MLKNVGAQWFRTVIFIVVGLLIPPLMYRFLGKGTYGTWEIVMSTTGIMKLLALGVPLSAVRCVAQYSAAKDEQKLNAAVGTCTGIYLVIGTAALVVGAGLYAFFELVYVPTRVAPEDVTPARIAFALIVLHVAASFVMQLPYSIMAGHHEFVRQNQIMVGVLLGRVGLIVAVLMLSGSLILLAVVELLTLAAEFLLPRGFLRKHYPDVRMKVANFDRSMMKTIFSFGGYVMLLHVGMRLAFQTDALVIGKAIDTESVVDYARANTFVVYMIELMIAVGGVIMPLATKMKTEENLDGLHDIFLKWSKISLALSFMVGLYLLVLGPEFIAWWMGDPEFKVTTADVMPALMLSSFIFLPVRAVALPMLLGLGMVRFPALLFLGVGLLNLGLSIALVGPLGLFGVALGTAIPNVLYAAVVLVYACRAIDAPVGRWLAYVAPKSILGALPVFGFLWWAKHEFAPESFLELFAAGLISVALFAVVWIFFVYRRDPFIDLSARVARLLGRSKS